MSMFFNFGESVEGYDFKVINERDARASAGIMFLVGLLSVFSVFTLRTLLWAELFSITFIIEFFIRTVINPKYAPYMMLGELAVYHQEPDWVEAKPKQFAWFLGLILGAIMTFYILFDVISLVRLSICFVCLTLMFLESAFGICLGCILFQKLKIKVEKCPGGVCDTTIKRSYNKRKLIGILLFVGLFFLTYGSLRYFKYEHRPRIVIVDE